MPKLLEDKCEGTKQSAILPSNDLQTATEI
jgi:hypothetical protein